MSFSELEFTQFFVDVRPALRYFADGFLHDHESAEDVLMDAFEKLWAKRADFDNLKAAKVFLYTVVKHACLNQQRNQKVRSRYQRWLINELEREGMEDVIERKILEAEVKKKWMSAVESLPVQCKRVLRIYLTGKRPTEIAATLGVSPQAVRQTQKRIQTMLRQRLTRDGL